MYEEGTVEEKNVEEKLPDLELLIHVCIFKKLNFLGPNKKF